MEKSNKTRINPSESPEMMRWILTNITNAIKAPSAVYTVKPGIKYFKEIKGTQNEHFFKIEHFNPLKRCDTEKIYACYDNFEFLYEINNYLFSDFLKIDNYINKKYVYDMNTDSYVLRPQEQDKLQMIMKWIKSRAR